MDPQTAITRALSKINFAPDSATTLTVNQRVASVEKAMGWLVEKLREGLVQYQCPSCGEVEFLSKHQEGPTHRHDKALYLLRKAK